jgi:uncharacterized protein
MTQGSSGPLREFVLKLASRCNLACDYCYVYTGPDQSWRQRPAVMSQATIGKAAGRIAEHARTHRLGRVLVALHGGEPLLAGPDTTERLLTAVRGAMPSGSHADLVVQTNGVLLTPAFLDLFARHKVRVGVSLDGGKRANDQHRNHADGRSAYAEVSRALTLLGSARYRSLFAGILCTVDPARDPLTTYADLLAFDPPEVDFLLPHATWSRPPPRPPGGGATPYADWLLAIFDQWYSSSAGDVRIRFFDEMIQLLLGGTTGLESLGGGAPGFAVIETDGAIEGSDTLKIAYHGAGRTGMSVYTHSFDQALDHPVIAGPRLGRRALSPDCLSCPVVSVCGGGQYAHRYRAGHGFCHPSVYCADLRHLIEHVAGRVSRDLSRSQGVLACSSR